MSQAAARERPEEGKQPVAMLRDDLDSGWGFDASVERDGSRAIVRVSGDLDAATVPTLREILTDLIDSESNLSLDVDVSAVTFIDSTGLGLLVGTRRKLLDRGGHLTVVAPSAATTRVLEITGLVRLLDVRVAT